ncbi:MAG: ABC transporter ATP-binding protein [Micrococcales bacterium]|nr:MAG: ABC transporter ATP-binding protein [Micrococcales bacterium]PIE25844.1 MAG: ABC transporter ATP-binding protein [Micrococcales bacterium]
MLDIHHVTRRFGDLVAVDDVSFTVPAGQLVGFVGANGAGKTTTMRMMMGVLAPSDGDIHWGGEPITRSVQSTFGYMPEERGLYPKQKILDQLVYLGQLHGMRSSAARAQAGELLARLGLQERLKDKLEELSLGNQQRVQIAAALLGSPQALILDEPFSGLDPTAVDDMLGLLNDAAVAGVPILFSSHQLDVVERVCDRLVIMSAGRVVAAGTAAELRESGTTRHRLVCVGDAGWVRDIPGVHVADVDRDTAVVEILQDGADQDLVNAAVACGGLKEFAPIRPSLNQIYREVTGQ